MGHSTNQAGAQRTVQRQTAVRREADKIEGAVKQRRQLPEGKFIFQCSGDNACFVFFFFFFWPDTFFLLFLSFFCPHHVTMTLPVYFSPNTNPHPPLSPSPQHH